MTREQAIDEIKRQLTCEGFLERSKGGLYCCPKCGSGRGPNATGAVKYYADTNTWYCHACGSGGDAIDLYCMITGDTFPEAVTSLAAQLNIIIDNTPEERIRERMPAKTAAPRSFTAYYQECASRLEDAAGYLQERGISLETARAYGVGYDPAADPATAPGATGSAQKRHPCPRLIIPVSDGYYIARRTDGGSEYKKLMPKDATPDIFNLEALYRAQEVFITEGAIDALSIIEAGAQALALNSTAYAKRLVNAIEQRRPAAAIIISLDNDKSGSAAATEIENACKRLSLPYLMANISGAANDPNEALTTDRAAFTAAISEARAQAALIREEVAARENAAAQAEEAERQQRTGPGMVDAFLETIKSERFKPIPTGITDIDKAIGGGLMRQQIVLLGAAPGAGKTALAQWIFETMARNGEATCVYLNLEMSREQMLARSISRIAAENGDKITAAEILQGYKWTLEQEDAIKTAAAIYRREIAPRLIYNPTEASSNLTGILQYMEEEAKRAEDAGEPAPIVILDYLQIIRGDLREEDAALIKRAVDGLKKYAINHDTIVFVIIAHNRESNRSGTVTMESGRDTSALEYAADLQMGLAFTRCLKRNGQDGKNREDLTPDELHYLTLRVTKGRFANPGAEVDLYFDGATMTYTQLDKAHSQEDSRVWRRV